MAEALGALCRGGGWSYAAIWRSDCRDPRGVITEQHASLMRLLLLLDLPYLGGPLARCRCLFLPVVQENSGSVFLQKLSVQLYTAAFIFSGFSMECEIPTSNLRNSVSRPKNEKIEEHIGISS